MVNTEYDIRVDKSNSAGPIMEIRRILLPDFVAVSASAAAAVAVAVSQIPVYIHTRRERKREVVVASCSSSVLPPLRSLTEAKRRRRVTSVAKSQ